MWRRSTLRPWRFCTASESIPIIARGQRCSTFALELHTVFHRELAADHPISIETRVLAFDAKRIHIFHQIKHAEENFLAASFEVVTIHVDLEKRRSSPFPT